MGSKNNKREWEHKNGTTNTHNLTVLVVNIKINNFIQTNKQTKTNKIKIKKSQLKQSGQRK